MSDQKQNVCELTIDRARWLRGEGVMASSLLRGRDRKMCCLGFLAKACGYDDNDLIYASVPSNILGERMMPDWCYGDDKHSTLSKIVRANDMEMINDQEREQNISELMLSEGIKVTFVG